MSKKLALILSSLLLVILLAGGVWYFFYVSGAKSDDPSLAKIQELKSDAEPYAAPTADLAYTDEAGFSFQYPKDIIVEDTTPVDKEYYSQVTLKKQEETLTLSVMDTTYKTTTAWAESLSTGKPSLVGSTSLGSLKADQYTYNNDFVTISIDKGVMYLITGPNVDYWEEVQNVIASSFLFAGQTTTTATTQGATEIIYEEEIIE